MYFFETLCKDISNAHDEDKAHCHPNDFYCKTKKRKMKKNDELTYKEIMDRISLLHEQSKHKKTIQNVVTPQVTHERRKKPRKYPKKVESYDPENITQGIIQNMCDAINPDVYCRLVEFLANEYDMTMKEAENYIYDNIFCQSNKTKGNLWPNKHQTKWVEELSRALSTRTETYFNSMLAHKNPLVKEMTKEIFKQLTDLTGEEFSFRHPTTKKQQLMVLAATRLAIWTDELLADLDKPRRTILYTEEEDEKVEEKKVSEEQFKAGDTIEEDIKKEEKEEKEEEMEGEEEKELQEEEKEVKEEEIEGEEEKGHEEKELQEEEKEVKEDEMEGEEEKKVQQGEKDVKEDEIEVQEEEKAQEDEKEVQEEENKINEEEKELNEENEIMKEKEVLEEEKKEESTEEKVEIQDAGNEAENDAAKEEENEKQEGVKEGANEDTKEEDDKEDKDLKENKEGEEENMQIPGKEEELEMKMENNLMDKEKEETEDSKELRNIEDDQNEDEAKGDKENEEKKDETVLESKEEKIEDEEEQEITLEDAETEKSPEAEPVETEQEAETQLPKEIDDGDLSKKESTVNPISDILDIIKEDIAEISKDKQTDRQKHVKDIITKQIKKLIPTDIEREEADIEDAASKVAHWIDNILETAEAPKKVDHHKTPEPAFAVRQKTGSTLEVQKLSSSTVAKTTAQARGVEIPCKTKNISISKSPVNLRSIQEWNDWATNMENVSVQLGEWIESMLNNAERQVADKNKSTLVEHRDWKQWQNQARIEAQKWRSETEKIKDEGKTLTKKLQKEENK